MKTTFECPTPLRAEQELKIVERDESGAMVGFYRGYWYPKKCAVALYPANNPYCLWTIKREKKLIYDGLVIIRPERITFNVASCPELPPVVKRRYNPFPGKDAKPALIDGQEKIEI